MNSSEITSMNNTVLRLPAILLFIFLSVIVYPQKKTTITTQQKKNTTTPAAKKTSNTKQVPGKGIKSNLQESVKPIITEFTPEQIEGFRTQCSGLVKFFEGTLNFLADKKNPVKEKEIIINESYLKFFMNEKVQVEDDLDEKRLVPLYKDIPAYLSDVDFFFGSQFSL